MAKIISQITTFEYTEIEILEDLERLGLALDGMDDEELMRKLEKRRGKGRNDYPVRVMWNLTLAMKIFGHKSVESFRRELSRNSQLRRICGLEDFSMKKHLVPPARVFTGFFKLLQAVQDGLDDIFTGEVDTLYEMLPSFGEHMAGDGKYLDSYAKRPPKDGALGTDLRTENDAEFSVKEYHYTGNDGKKHVKKETHYGFKAHIVCDTDTELPIALSVTKANRDEKKEMIALLGGFDGKRRDRAKSVALDRGYDSINMIRCVKAMGASPIADIRNCWKDGETTKQYKDTDIVYTYKGEVFYCEKSDALTKMKYEGYDRNKKCLRYSHHGKIYKIYISADERVFLPVARDSMKFDKLYKGRTSVERLNGRIDRDFMFEDHFIRGLPKMRMLLSLSLIVMNAMAIGKLKRGIRKHLAAVTKTGLPRVA
jgi:hypothetical protein